VAGHGDNRPPPDGGARARRLPWRRAHSEPRGRRARRDAAYEHSDAAEQERVIVEALADLRDMDVREVMTPRTDVVALSIPVTADDIAKAVRESGHSAYPVVNGVLDDVVGVLYVNDLFRSRRWRGGLSGSEGDRAQEELPFNDSIMQDAAVALPAATGPVTSPHPAASGPVTPPHPAASPRVSAAKTAEGREPAGLSEIEISRRIRQAYVVPESRPILAALVEMRRHRRGFAVVVDEYGGVSGVLTVKDLLEPIVGELHDELDVDEGPSIVRIDSSRWLVDGQTNVDEVRERLHISVPEGEYVTLGGFILDALGHIPVEGERVQVDGWELTVHEMDKRRIAGVLVRGREDRHAGEPAGLFGQPAPPESSADQLLGAPDPDATDLQTQPRASGHALAEGSFHTSDETTPPGRGLEGLE
jgi:CBS domain containing-hemolysin-like protein